MAVTLHPPSNPQRFRITRTWKGQPYQLYVPIGKDIEKARKLAKELDESLAQRQRAYRHRLELEGRHVLHHEDSVIGLNYHKRQRSGRKLFERFHCRLNQGGQIIFKDFVINTERPFDEAFRQAIEFIAEKRGVIKGSPLFKRMLAALPIYENKRSGQVQQRPHDETDELLLALSQEVADFERKQKCQVIQGAF